jgi:hypothetical protein
MGVILSPWGGVVGIDRHATCRLFVLWEAVVEIRGTRGQLRVRIPLGVVCLAAGAALAATAKRLTSYAMRPRLRADDRRTKNLVTWLGAAALAAASVALLDQLRRRYDAKLLAEHEHARKMAKRAKKKAKKAKKKLAKGKPPVLGVVGNDHR